MARYQIGKGLGEGAEGAVLEAELLGSRGFRLPLAIKLALGANDAAARLRQEARVLAGLKSDAILTAVDSFEVDSGTWALVTQRVDGVTLREVLLQGAEMPDDASVGMAARVAGALAIVHSQGIVHRDIKPANVMITEHGEVKVLDFGIAARTGGAAGRGDASGTPRYRPREAPERPLDGSFDIFSLGVMLYELLTRERLADDAVVSGALPEYAAHLGAAEAHLARLDPGLRQLVLAMVAADAKARPTADAVARHLASLEPAAPVALARWAGLHVPALMALRPPRNDSAWTGRLLDSNAPVADEQGAPALGSGRKTSWLIGQVAVVAAAVAIAGFAATAMAGFTGAAGLYAGSLLGETGTREAAPRPRPVAAPQPTEPKAEAKKEEAPAPRPAARLVVGPLVTSAEVGGRWGQLPAVSIAPESARAYCRAAGGDLPDLAAHPTTWTAGAGRPLAEWRLESGEVVALASDGGRAGQEMSWTTGFRCKWRGVR
jgi:serine/threonine-protein kinase